LSVPAQDGIGRKERADVAQDFAAEDFAFDGQPAALVVGEHQASVAKDFPEHLNLGVLILQALLLRAIDPTGENGGQELPGLENDVHEAPACVFGSPGGARIRLDRGLNGSIGT
jgi:hypothetical protein